METKRKTVVQLLTDNQLASIRYDPIKCHVTITSALTGYEVGFCQEESLSPRLLEEGVGVIVTDDGSGGHSVFGLFHIWGVEDYPLKHEIISPEWVTGTSYTDSGGSKVIRFKANLITLTPASFKYYNDLIQRYRMVNPECIGHLNEQKEDDNA